jgi:hypothetical protein
MTAEQTLSLTARLAALTILISTLEYLANTRLLRDEGLMNWPIGRLRFMTLSVGRPAAILNALLRYPNVIFLLALQASLSAVVVAGPTAWTLSPSVLLGIYALLFLIEVRSRYGHDGADQLAGFVMLGVGVSGLVPTPLSRAACLLFFSFQACLAYATAGWTKFPMPGWRDGSYLSALMTARIYGMPPLGRYLTRRPEFAKVASRAVLAWECIFPLVLVLPAPAAFAMLGMGIVFHVMNAFVMGLNCFVWSFLAVYPPLVWTIQHRGW